MVVNSLSMSLYMLYWC